MCSGPGTGGTSNLGVSIPMYSHTASPSLMERGSLVGEVVSTSLPVTHSNVTSRLSTGPAVDNPHVIKTGCTPGCCCPRTPSVTLTTAVELSTPAVMLPGPLHHPASHSTHNAVHMPRIVNSLLSITETIDDPKECMHSIGHKYSPGNVVGPSTVVSAGPGPGIPGEINLPSHPTTVMANVLATVTLSSRAHSLMREYIFEEAV